MVVFYNIFGKMSREFRTYLEKLLFCFQKNRGGSVFQPYFADDFIRVQFLVELGLDCTEFQIQRVAPFDVKCYAGTVEGYKGVALLVDFGEKFIDVF